MPRGAVVFGAALAICLIAGSPPRIVGDGGEYLAQAINFESFHKPSLRPPDIPAIQQRIAAFDPALDKWDILQATVAGSDRRRDFLHFWFYALLATPPLWIADAVGVPPTFAFAAVNLALFLLALSIALPRIGPAASVLLFAGPIIWWLDKAHTEVFTFALLTIAFALARERPWWSMVAAGAASTQNPPIAILVPLFLGATLATHGRRGVSRHVLAGAAAGLALALLHPVYTYVRHGTPSLLLYATRSDTARPAEQIGRAHV